MTHSSRPLSAAVLVPKLRELRKRFQEGEPAETLRSEIQTLTAGLPTERATAAELAVFHPQDVFLARLERAAQRTETAEHQALASLEAQTPVFETSSPPDVQDGADTPLFDTPVLSKDPLASVVEPNAPSLHSMASVAPGENFLSLVVLARKSYFFNVLFFADPDFAARITPGRADPLHLTPIECPGLSEALRGGFDETTLTKAYEALKTQAPGAKLRLMFSLSLHSLLERSLASAAPPASEAHPLSWPAPAFFKALLAGELPEASPDMRQAQITMKGFEWAKALAARTEPLAWRNTPAELRERFEHSLNSFLTETWLPSKLGSSSSG